MSRTGNIIRNIGSSSTKTAKHIHFLATEGNLNFNSVQEVVMQGKENGTKFTDFEGIESTADDFIPIVELDLNQFKNEGQNRCYSGFHIKKNTGRINLSTEIESGKRSHITHTLQITEKEATVKFLVKQGNSTATDSDGYIEIRPNGVNVKTNTRIKIEYNQAIALVISQDNIQEGAYTDFYASDDGEGWGDTIGKSNIHCGRVLVKAMQYYRFNPSSAKGQGYSKFLAQSYNKRESWNAKKPMLCGNRSFDPYILIDKSKSITQADQEGIPVLQREYFGIAIHHSGNSGLNTMIQIQNEHMNENERADIGYHFGISLSGQVFEGRYLGVKGSHLDAYNTGIIGIVFLADFDHTYQWDFNGESTMTQAAMVSLITLIRALKEQFTRINVLGGHKEWKNNRGRRCPGDYGLEYISEIRKLVGMKSPDEAGHG